jgi:hypothetical protein
MGTPRSVLSLDLQLGYGQGQADTVPAWPIVYAIKYEEFTLAGVLRAVLPTFTGSSFKQASMWCTGLE